MNFKKENFDSVGNSIDAWFGKAKELLYCSEGLQEFADTKSSQHYDLMEQLPHQVNVYWVKIMLRGFAVECLIKALWLKAGHRLCEDGRYVGVDGIKNHRMHEMISRLDLSISKVERTVLRILSAAATSGGRYPVYVRYDSLQKDFGSGDLTFIQRWNDYELEPAYHSLKDRLIQLIED